MRGGDNPRTYLQEHLLRGHCTLDSSGLRSGRVPSESIKDMKASCIVALENFYEDVAVSDAKSHAGYEDAKRTFFIRGPYSAKLSRRWRQNPGKCPQNKQNAPEKV